MHLNPPPHPGETWGIRQLKGKKGEKAPLKEESFYTHLEIRPKHVLLQSTNSVLFTSSENMDFSHTTQIFAVHGRARRRERHTACQVP